MEKWKPIPGYETTYAVSDGGRVKRLPRMVQNGVGTVALGERINKPSLSRGYHRVSLWADNRGSVHFVHRLVMLAFVGQSALSVDHINGDKTDNRLCNLRYCTLSENTRYQHADGRVVFVRGVENGRAKLDDDAVRSIRRMLAVGASSQQTADAHGISKGAVQAIREKRTWVHVT